MNYKYVYYTPNNFSNIIMTSDGEYLTGLYFSDSQDLSKNITEYKEEDLVIFRKTSKWLDIYFSGKVPNFTPEYKIINETPFRKEVIDIMKTISYGSTITYGEISKLIAQKRGITKMSSQAVGGAVGSNPICIIIPCHRVVGVNNNLTGYGGGIKNKIELLKLEGIDISKYTIPKKR